MSKGILLDKFNDLNIIVRRNSSGLISGGLVIGESILQDAFMVLQSNKGEFKEDPIAGANLITQIRSGYNKDKLRKNVKISLERVNINFESIRPQIELFINQQKTEL